VILERTVTPVRVQRAVRVRNRLGLEEERRERSSNLFNISIRGGRFNMEKENKKQGDEESEN
jgi:hypothetical protein